MAPAGDPAPAPGDAYSFLELSARATYAGADAGKTAHYLLHWVSARDEPGPWSEVASATVADEARE